MPWSLSDLKFWFYLLAGFALVYAACLYLQAGEMSAENERLTRERGWVTVIPAPPRSAPASKVVSADDSQADF